MTCSEIQALLADAAPGAPPSEATGHLAGCASCRAAAVSFAQTVDRLRGAAPAPITDAAIARIAAGVRARRTPAVAPWRTRSAAAALFLAVWGWSAFAILHAPGPASPRRVAAPRTIPAPRRVEWTFRDADQGITVYWVFDKDIEFSLPAAREERR